MSERNGFEPGVPCWVATIQPDPPAAADFYAAVFGWEIDERDTYFVGRLRGRDVAAVAPLPPMVSPPPPAGWTTSVCVASADAAAHTAERAGGRVVAGPFDVPTGRMAVVADPQGAVLSLVQHDRYPAAQVVNEPGAWSMSSLSAPDPEAAAPFYAALFGWTTEAFAMGELSATMFRLPGYVGGEPEQPVSREVVATMAPAAEGQPAGWAVDFWVDDVDAAVARATQRGGSVVAAPFELPIGRSAVLADPAGAAFSITAIAARASGAGD